MSNDARRALLLRIVAVVASGPSAAVVFTSACGGQAEPPRANDRPDAGGDASASNASNAPPFELPSSTTPSPPAPTFGPPADCPAPLEASARSSPCASDAGHSLPVCFPLPDGGTCAGAYPEECILWGYECGLIRRGDAVKCEIPADDACCWEVSGGCAVGRPFVVEGKTILSRAVASDAWSLGDHDVAACDARTRRVLADVWERDGLAEHASVASFARFALELLALGAPPDLLTGAQQAMREEIGHAQRCFTLASAYAGAPRGPGALDVRGALAREIELADFAARTAAEGCIAETVFALQLQAAADAARDPSLSTMLRAMAEEESEHALLAWRTVRWAIAKGGARVRDAVRRVFANAASHVGFGPCPSDDVDPDLVREHGVLPRRERHDLALAALASVVAPAAAELLAANPIRSSERSRPSP